MAQSSTTPTTAWDRCRRKGRWPPKMEAPIMWAKTLWIKLMLKAITLVSTSSARPSSIMTNERGLAVKTLKTPEETTWPLRSRERSTTTRLSSSSTRATKMPLAPSTSISWVKGTSCHPKPSTEWGEILTFSVNKPHKTWALKAIFTCPLPTGMLG